MSRRPAAGADRAAQNAQTLKALVKLEGNKVCADCKRNKHPRWASWNLGVFICIRCSGIHRGMGTHISRVKSVDLDAWTDEQLQSVLKWGNSRANKYWEAKLAAGHVPSEAKMENFIRTKYESKRWVMEGPMPDPATLDNGDDDVPLNIVQEKAKIDRSTSQRQQAAPPRPQPQVRAAPAVDLFDDFTPSPPVRPSTADIPQTKAATAAPVNQPKPNKPQDSLLGLDFFGGSTSAGIGRPSSAASNPVSSSNPRGDLKNSILSLYASAPKPQPAPQPVHERQPSFGGMASAPAPKQDAFGGLADAFGGLNFSSSAAPKSPPMQSPKPAFPTTTNFPATVPAKSTPSAAQVSSPPPLSGGGFFDMTPKSPPAHKPPTVPQRQASTGLDFSFASNPAPALATAQPAKSNTSSIPTDLFSSDDFGGFASSIPASPPVPKVSSPVTTTQPNYSSAFNLSSQSTVPKPATQQSQPAMTMQSSNTMFDPWGSGNDSSPWGAPEPAPAPSKPKVPSVNLGTVPTHITPNDISGGWGAPISSASKPVQQPTVAADEDFGGWTSASTTQTPATAAPPKGSGGFTSASDPFDNPWG